MNPTHGAETRMNTVPALSSSPESVAIYKEALALARQRLAEAERNYDAIVQRIQECEREENQLRFLITSLAVLIDEPVNLPEPSKPFVVSRRRVKTR